MVGLNDREMWDFEVGGINTNFVNEGTNYTNSIRTQPTTAVASCA